MSKRRKNKQSGTGYERRTLHKGVYGFRRWSSIGIFDVGKLDYDNGELKFFLVQNKFSRIREPYISSQEVQRIKDFINQYGLCKEKYPWLWIGIFFKRAYHPERREQLN